MVGCATPGAGLGNPGGIPRFDLQGFTAFCGWRSRVDDFPKVKKMMIQKSASKNESKDESWCRTGRIVESCLERFVFQHPKWDLVQRSRPRRQMLRAK